MLLVTVLVVEGIAVAQKTQGESRHVCGVQEAYLKGLQLQGTVSIVPLPCSSDLRLPVFLSASM